MSSVPVRFSATTYYVTEGESTVVITLEALTFPTEAFTVNVVTRDGTAYGECQYILTNPFQYHCCNVQS